MTRAINAGHIRSRSAARCGAPCCSADDLESDSSACAGGHRYDERQFDAAQLKAAGRRAFQMANRHGASVTRVGAGISRILFVQVAIELCREGKEPQRTGARFLFGTIGKRVLTRAFENIVKAIEARNGAGRK